MKGIVSRVIFGVEENKPAGREILILRHGETILNKEDKIRAWLDVPLTETGIEQAHLLSEELADSGIELDGMYVSDLQRCIHTAFEVSKITGIPIMGTTKVLRPWNVGKLSGTDGKKAHAIMAEHARSAPDEPVGGDGESFNIFKYRFLGGIIGLLNSHRGQKLGFVSHSRGERIMHAWVAAGCDENLEIDLDVFLAHGEPTASAQLLTIDCPLVLP